jgi:peptide/nickel transport system substrate-binding protein
VVAVVLPAGGVRHEGTAPGGHTTARRETLYTSGTSSGPPTNFNPLAATSYTGSQGLLYEPLFLYDPVHSRFIPWLASSGGWATPTIYRLEVRSGVSWVSSRSGSVTGALRGADVVYSIKLAVSDAADPYHTDVASVRSAIAVGQTVTVRFAGPVGYAQWQDYLWHSPVLPEAVWSRLPPGRQVSAPNLAPVSTGPMLLATTRPTEACYRDNPHWWGTAQLGLSFKFEYLCNVVRGSSGAELSDLLNGNIDWSNELLRGVPDLADAYGIKTYYDGAPYMLPASTAWLQLDTARAPMSSADFRKAVAYALDPAAIVSGVYAGAVKVANPTGLLPGLAAFINRRVVHRYAFHYSTSLARKYLAKSGYRRQDLTLEVPQGWEDLLDAATMICVQLGKVGIHVTVRAVSLRARDADVAVGNYEMVINMAVGPSPTPWAYFEDVYALPVTAEQVTGANTERFSSPAAWSLVEQAAATPTTDTAALRNTYSKLEGDFLQDLPEIPLWYPGAWFQANTAHWQDYPASSSPRDQYTPVMWPGWLGSTTTVYALAELKPR